MRQLHVVALSEDGRFLLLAPTKDAAKGSFKIPVDARLTAAVRGELPRPGQTTAPVSGLTPKEIQARLRAGETVEQVARAAGVPPARVERFAGPVEGERARTIDAARAAVLTRARRGASAVSLGDAVTAHLVDAGVDPAEVEWTARREDDGSWLVAAAFSVRGRKKRSTWRYEPGTRELSAIDASSAVLGYVEPPETERRPTTKTISPVRSAGRSSRSSRRTTLTERRSPAAPQVPAAAKAPDASAATPSSRAPARRKTRGAAPVARRTPPASTQVAPATPTRVAAPARRSAKAPVAVKAAARAPAAARKAPAAAKAVAAAKAPAAATRTAKKAAAPKKATATGTAPVTSTAAAPKKATATSRAAASRKAPATKAAGGGKKVVVTRKAPARSAATASTAPATTAATTTVRAPAQVADVRVAAPPRRRRRAAAAPSAPEIAMPTSATGTAPDGPPQLRVVPPPDEEPRGRASVPTWADVLLSTTPPSRPAAPRDDD